MREFLLKINIFRNWENYSSLKKNLIIILSFFSGWSFVKVLKNMPFSFELFVPLFPLVILFVIAIIGIPFMIVILIQDRKELKLNIIPLLILLFFPIVDIEFDLIDNTFEVFKKDRILSAQSESTIGGDELIIRSDSTAEYNQISILMKNVYFGIYKRIGNKHCIEFEEAPFANGYFKHYSKRIPLSFEDETVCFELNDKGFCFDYLEIDEISK